MKLQHLFLLLSTLIIINNAVSAELSVHAEQGTNSDVGTNSNVAPNVASSQPKAKSEPIRQTEEKAINGTTQTTNQTDQALLNRVVTDPVHKHHHRPAQHPGHHQAGVRPSHQPHPPQQHAMRHPARLPYYSRQPSIRRFLIYGRPHNRPDLPLVLIYPRASGNYSRNTLAMFRAISESPNKPILGLNIIPFLGMNLISEVLGLDLTLIPERKDDSDQVEDDSIHFPSDMNKDQLLHLMEQHGMVPMLKDDEEESNEVQPTKKDKLVLMGHQAAPEYHPPTPNSVNRGMLQLMSNYNRREIEDENVPHIQPRSLGILAKFHPRFNIKNEDELEISEVNRKRRSAEEDKQEDMNTTTNSTTESSSSHAMTESDSKHSNSSNESSNSKRSESSNKEVESSESSESKHSEYSDNNDSTTESNSNSTTTDESRKTVSQILEQLLIDVIEFLFH